MWTTTPWTLLSNTGVAVNPDLTYAVVDGMVVADELVDAVFGEGASARVTARVPGLGPGRAALRAPVRRPGPAARRRRLAGRAGRLRHDRGGHRARAPGPGLRRDRPPDRPGERPALAQPGRPRRPLHRRTVDWLAGRDVREANHDINDRLEADGPADPPRPATSTRTRTAGAAARRSSTGASRAGTSPPRPARTTCWRRTQTVDWHPAHIRTAASASGWPTTSTGRCRATATGARRCPIWRCGRGHVRCVGSLAELSDLCGRDVTGIDPHRPTIDEVTFACSTCAPT